MGLTMCCHRTTKVSCLAVQHGGDPVSNNKKRHINEYKESTTVTVPTAPFSEIHGNVHDQDIIR